MIDRDSHIKQINPCSRNTWPWKRLLLELLAIFGIALLIILVSTAIAYTRAKENPAHPVSTINSDVAKKQLDELLKVLSYFSCEESIDFITLKSESCQEGKRNSKDMELLNMLRISEADKEIELHKNVKSALCWSQLKNIIKDENNRLFTQLFGGSNYNCYQFVMQSVASCWSCLKKGTNDPDCDPLMAQVIDNTVPRFSPSERSLYADKIWSILLNSKYISDQKKEREGKDYLHLLEDGIANLFSQTFWLKSVGAAILVLSAIILLTLSIIYLIMYIEIGKSPTRKAALLLLLPLTIPTFVASAFFYKIFRVNPIDDPFLTLVGLIVIGTLASGVSFDLVQVFRSSIATEYNKEYVSLLRSWGYKTNNSLNRMHVPFIYLYQTLAYVFFGKKQKWTNCTLAPLLFRATEYKNIEYFRRKVSLLVDALIVLEIFFSVDIAPAGFFQKFLSLLKETGVDASLSLMHSLNHGMISVVMLAGFFRLLGTIARWRLFPWK
jgi:hypothetical protein